MTYTVRSPVPDDSDGLGLVHVRAWQAAYRGGLMPDEYLDGLSAGERAANWRQALQNPPRPGAARFVAASADGGIVGFAVAGPADNDPEADHGELYVINVDPEHWGAGAGELLLSAATDALRAAGFSKALLWVHPGNDRACAFYRRHGWSSDDVTREQEVFGITVPELRYSRSL